MTGYDPGFRLAVEWDGTYYICEKTGHMDGSDLDVTALFEAAGFRETVTDITFFDHFLLHAVCDPVPVHRRDRERPLSPSG